MKRPPPLFPRRILVDALKRLDAHELARALKLGADPRALCHRGMTPLLSLVHAATGNPDLAASPERMACLRLLLPASQLNFTFSMHSWKPSLLACAIYSSPAGCSAVVRALLQAGARDGPDCDITALAMCGIQRRLDTARELIAAGFCSDVADGAGRTPLMRALAGNNVELIALLAERSNLHAVDRDGFTAMQHAERNATGERDAIVGLLSALLLSSREASEISASSQPELGRSSPATRL